MIKDKKIKFLIILALIVLVLWIITNYLTSTNKLHKYLLNNGFTKTENFYTKILTENDIDDYYQDIQNNINSNYKELYFSSENYQLIGNIQEYNEGLIYYYSPIYDYHEDTLTYDFEISNDNIQIIFEGDYNIISQKMNCNLSNTSSEIELTTDEKSIICKKIELDTKDFTKEVNKLFKDTNFLKKVRK